MSDLRAELQRLVATALAEDLGGPDATSDQDVTTRTTVGESVKAAGSFMAKQSGVVCGLEALEVTFHELDPGVEVTQERKDGDPVSPGDVLARIRGPARPILTGERTALNILCHLSGVATLTRAFVDRSGGAAAILETRKTLPGLRALEKYAVATGGGTNHRFGLHDGVLIKDNHIAAAGGVGEAVRRAVSGTTLAVQVECTSLDEVEEALGAGAGAILLDNRSIDELREICAFIRERNPGVLIEASGGITLEDVAEVASVGVDRISVGALTHSAPALDISLELDLDRPKAAPVNEKE